MRKILEEKDFLRRPWKNGRGITNEIMVSPPGSEHFVWRLSQATLGESGPFSVFPGIHRWLVLLEGNPVTLNHTGQSHCLKLLEPYAFSGAEETFAEVTATGKDFNLMLREGKASGSLSVGTTGSHTITTSVYGIYSLSHMTINGETISKNSFYYVEDESGETLSINSDKPFLIIQIEGTK